MRLWFCLAVLLAWQLSLVAKTESRTWETLEGCRLLKSNFNDGDSFVTKHGSNEYLFRIYWVDAPETTDTYETRNREQARYFSISPEKIPAVGAEATRFTRQFLSGKYTVHTKWEDARGGSRQRYFAIIEKDGEFLSDKLASKGLARIYGKPTPNKWPGGFTPSAYRSQLKKSERAAKLDGLGIWAYSKSSAKSPGSDSKSSKEENQDKPTYEKQSSRKIVNVNLASEDELDTLPGIGPALAQRIIATRPISDLEQLVDIPGISSKTLDGFRRLAATKDPPPPAKTARFYLADVKKYIGKEVVVLVEKVLANDIESPDSFSGVTLGTANAGISGGSITAFIPSEHLESFMELYSVPGLEFRGLLHQMGNETVLVYRRK